jgi:ComF family protein
MSQIYFFSKMKSKQILFQLNKQFLDTLYPRECKVCDGVLSSNESEICIACEFNLPFLDDAQINEFIKTFWVDTEIKQIEALLSYSKKSMAQKIFKEIKYHKNQALAFKMGQIFGIKLLNEAKVDFDVIIPVPLHLKKLKSRGFNQSAIIAKGLTDILNIELGEKIVSREKNTKSQTKMGRSERWENVDSIFRISNKEAIAGKNVALLDDVITTGATLNSLAESISKCAPNSISYLCLACPV